MRNCIQAPQRGGRERLGSDAHPRLQRKRATQECRRRRSASAQAAKSLARLLLLRRARRQALMFTHPQGTHAREQELEREERPRRQQAVAA